MNPRRTPWLLILFAALALAFGSACGTADQTDPSDGGDTASDSGDAGGDTSVNPDPVPGQDDFLSADGRPGEDAGNGGDNGDGDGADDDMAGAPEAGDERGDDTTVEEGDIYRVLGEQRILNLNAYRGLQIIDFSDASAPHIIGRYSITGWPVELYTYEDRAIVLMNNWRGYYGSRFSTLLQEVSGGVVAVIDISRPEKPVLLSQSHIPGYIQRSRLVHGGGQASLYVAASEYGRFLDPDTGNEEWGQRTYVKSFDVSGPIIEDRTELELGGYVTDIQATPRALMVARGNHNWWSRGDGSTVTLIDISNPNGTMVRGDEVRVRGRVQSQFNMDLYNGVLRVVSGNRWGSGQGNWIQTFDASDFSELSLIDEETFGNPNEDLFATLFLGNKAFFVTYFQVDPFHAFEITDEGIATERTEFIVSGWNDFFRAVHGTTRLIGIGMNDEGGTARAAVSLYDITDLYNAEPLIERAEVSTARWTWSEANWDHRAFSVLENAVSVTNEDGVEETGLVLLPFSGWDDDNYRSAVQIFTFSENTLTLRGTMEHPDPVRRTFLPEEDTATNFSETEMRFHDVSDPDEPSQLGSVELAPNFSDVWVFGDIAARHRQPNTYWWYYRSNERPDGAIEFFRTSEDPDVASSIGSVEIPGNANVIRTPDGLIVVTTLSSSYGNGRDHTAHVRIQTVDFSNPASPTLSRGAEMDLPGWWGRGGYYDDYWYGYDYGGYYGSPAMDFAQDVLVYRQAETQQQELGQEEHCWYRWRNNVARNDCWSNDHGDWNPEDPEETWECTSYEGYRSCTTDHRGNTTCRGEFARCEISMPNWERVSCEPLSEEEIQQHYRRDCDTYTAYRHWQSWTLHRIDMQDPDSPRLLAPLATDPAHEMRSARPFEGTYHMSWAVPVELENDNRPYVRWFFREVDLRADSADEAFGRAVNVPGELVQREGNAILTRDNLYGRNIVETSINRLDVVGERAVLRGTERFRDAWVRDIALDGGGLILVNHQPWQTYRGGWGWYDDVVTNDGDDGDDDEDLTSSRLSIYRIADAGFSAAANVPVDDWAHLRAATPGRAIFSAGGGVLVMNLDDPANPFPQTYSGLRGWWPSRFVPVGDRLWIPTGRFGIQEIDANDWNLIGLE